MPKILSSAIGASLFLLVGCASTTSVHIEPADSFAVSASEDARSMLTRYERVLIDPVELTPADEVHWKDVDEAMRIEAAHLVHEHFEQATGAHMIVTDKPGSGVLRLHLTVEDLKLSKPAAQTPKNMGQIMIRGELLDSQNGTLLASFWTQQGPDPMNLGAAINQDAAMKAAIDKTAKKFAEALTKARTETTSCAKDAEQLCIKPQTPNLPKR